MVAFVSIFFAAFRKNYCKKLGALITLWKELNEWIFPTISIFTARNAIEIWAFIANPKDLLDNCNAYGGKAVWFPPYVPVHVAEECFWDLSCEWNDCPNSDILQNLICGHHFSRQAFLNQKSAFGNIRCSSTRLTVTVKMRTNFWYWIKKCCGLCFHILLAMSCDRYQVRDLKLSFCKKLLEELLRMRFSVSTSISNDRHIATAKRKSQKALMESYIWSNLSTLRPVTSGYKHSCLATPRTHHWIALLYLTPNF